MDCTTVPAQDADVERRGAGCEPGALLAEGRFAEAREALRLARRRTAAGRSPAALALLECDALAGLGRDAEVVALATRTLARTVADRDVAARLRVARALALWQGGRVGAARGEVRRALQDAEQPLTRARALEALATFAWKDQELARAHDLAEQAAALHDAGGSAAGRVRAEGIAAAAARDGWRLPEALATHERRLRAAHALARPHVVREVEADRASVLAAQGRWEEAARALDAPGGGSEEPLAAELLRAGLARAHGDLGGARAALGRFQARLAPRTSPRLRADAFVIASDVTLVAGDAVSAEQEALQAVRLFDLVADRGGRSRGRVRRAHALLVLARAGEAVTEARRALAEASAERPDLRAHAGLALARGLWRTHPAEAEAICARVAELSRDQPGFLSVARFGQALAGGAEPAVIAERLAAVEAWGDRRALSYCLTELRHAGHEDRVVVPAPVPAVRADHVEVDPLARTVVDAVHALADEGPWTDRWSAAARALAPILPWCRTAYVAEPGFELRRHDEQARPLREDDLARLVARQARGAGASVVDLLGASPLRLHPVRALHALGAAVVAPVGEAALLYFDFHEDAGVPSGRQVAAVAQVARLLARFPPEPTAVAQTGEGTIPGLVGQSPAMRTLFDAIERAAGFDLNTHVCGETGTGKERVAQALHQRSPRLTKPFVAVNASSLGDDLFESEMFGHLRGSFTGAVADREGHVAAAEGGTLFLDEITDLSPRAQAKLLRLLELKEYRRVGESRTRTADVRFVTASNVPLEQRVAEGRFRADLMYRLHRAVLDVPALRDRGDDVGLLARHFLRKAAGRARTPVRLLTPDGERILRGHSWPGNVRELENEMDRLVLMGGRGPIRRHDLSPRLVEPPVRGASCLRAAVLDFEREHITRALRMHGGNRARTACALGLTRQALVAKISRLGLAAAGPR